MSTATPTFVTTARRGQARLRALAVAPVAHVALADLLLLGRTLGVVAIVGAALAVQTWTRTEVRHESVALASARSSLAEAQILHQRLLLERSVRRQPTHLQAGAERLGLSAPVAVHQVRE